MDKKICLVENRWQITGLYPLSNSGMPADSSADSSTDHPVGMAYLLGNWVIDHVVTAVAGRLGTADLCQAYLIFHRRLGDESAWL